MGILYLKRKHMNKIFKLVILVFFSISIITLLADTFSKLSDSLFQYLIITAIILIIFLDLYLIKRILKS